MSGGMNFTNVTFTYMEMIVTYFIYNILRTSIKELLDDLKCGYAGFPELFIIPTSWLFEIDLTNFAVKPKIYMCNFTNLNTRENLIPKS